MAAPSQMQDAERDALVVALRTDGETFKEIGRRLGITRQRVAQIWERAVAPTPEPEPCWCGAAIPWNPGPGARRRFCTPEHAPRTPFVRRKVAAAPRRRRQFVRCSACNVGYDKPRSTPCCSECGAKFRTMRRVHYAQLASAQDHLCAICGSPETAPIKSGGTRRLAIDHCHASGAIRGLLCMKCNVLLGAASDDPGILERAAAYLKKHGAADSDGAV